MQHTSNILRMYNQNPNFTFKFNKENKNIEKNIFFSLVALLALIKAEKTLITSNVFSRNIT